MSISQPPVQSTLVDANDRVQTPWAQWFSQLQPILQSVVASGPTSGRPTQNLYIGYPYFDTTIDQMVYWNGVIWVTYAPSTTGTSILKGNGSGGFTNAVAGIDFAPATTGNAILYGNGAGGFSSVSIGSGVTFAGGVLSATGSGGTVTAVTGTAPIASSGGTTPAISISQAGASTNGYLSSIDWNIFNSKAPATSGASILYGNGTGGFSNVTIGSGITFVAGTLSATGSGGTVTAVTGTAPIASSGGTAPAISISQAGTATDGYLTSIDWNTFNNKGLGTVTAVTGSGNIASSGGTTPNITFTGTLPIANGGTNGTATPTAGAVAVGNGTQYAFTAAGSAGQVLTSNGSTVPTWATVATGIGTTGYWGSFWDTTNQTATSTTIAYTINIGTSDPNNNGVSIVSSNQITVAYAGVYNIQYSIQFQNIGSGNKNYNVDVWFRLNGVDIPDSNSTYWIPSKNSTVNGELIAAVNYVLSLAAGDYIQLMWAVSDVDISIATLPAASSPTVPRTPGVIVTVTPITEVGIGYYNLTSVSSVAIATGSKTFTTNLSNISTAFTVGTRIRVAYVTTPANYMEGVITSFSGTTLVVNVDSIGGSGSYANWTISVAGIQGSNGVTSITGTTNQVIASASTGAVTLSLPQSINSGATPTFTGTNFTGIPNAGLTNSSITINGSSVSLGGSTTVTATATNALTIGTGLSGTSYNGSTAVTIANSGVLSFSGNSTGLTPATATTGAITLAGTLVASNGGTGVAGTLTGISYMNGVSAHTVATTAQALSLIGTLPVANGGTGVTSSTGTGAVVLSGSPTFTGQVGFANIDTTTIVADGMGVRIRRSATGAAILQFTNNAASTQLASVSHDGSNLTIASSIGNTIVGTLQFADGSTQISHAAPQISVYGSGSGTYTTPANAKYLAIQMVGGGGNGGSSTGTTAGGGGGAGGWLSTIISSPSATYSYAVGAATGTSTFGTALLSAVGGSNGTSNSATAAGGVGGSSSGGNVANNSGSTGGYGWASVPYFNGGFGAGSFYGSGGSGGGTGNGGGLAANVVGAGGGGGVGGGSGGAGYSGAIFVTAYF